MRQRSNLTEAYSTQIMYNGSLPCMFSFSSFLLLTETRIWLFCVRKCLEDYCRGDFELVEWHGHLKRLIKLKVRFRSQRPRGLRRESAASCLLGLWFRIPPGHRYLYLLWLLCVVRYGSLRRGDHSSRGVWCVWVWWWKKLKQYFYRPRRIQRVPGS